MVRNATNLYYPIREAIMSILPIVDEFVVALGNCDEDDHTLEEIQRIQSDKIRIIHTVWDLEKYPHGMVHAHQTDIAKEACSGDWLFCVQSDEVVHEKYLDVIKKRCEELLHDEEVEGLLFDYRHFWGDYDHYFISHAWYNKEIRIIRNKKDIHSWQSAQSFRRIPNFDGIHYWDKRGTFKLKVAKVDAIIYHYGWVRPPKYMQKKNKAFTTIHKGEKAADEIFKNAETAYNFGDISKLHVQKETQPAVMLEMISKFNWAHELYPNVPLNPTQVHKHEKLKYKILTFFEQRFFGGNQLLAFKNYILLKRSVTKPQLPISCAQSLRRRWLCRKWFVLVQAFVLPESLVVSLTCTF